MPRSHKIRQEDNWDAVAFVSSAARMVFVDGAASEDTQATAVDGTPKWDVQAMGVFTENGRQQSEQIKFGVTGQKDPGDGLAMFTPIHAEGIRTGTYDKTDRQNRSQITGHGYWYTAESIRPATPTARRSTES